MFKHSLIFNLYFQAQAADLAPDDMAIEKKECGKGLVLRGGAGLLLDSQMRQQGVDLRLGHLRWMANVVEVDESLHPLAIGLLSSTAVVPRTQRLANLVKESWLPVPQKDYGAGVH